MAQIDFGQSDAKPRREGWLGAPVAVRNYRGELSLTLTEDGEIGEKDHEDDFIPSVPTVSLTEGLANRLGGRATVVALLIENSRETSPGDRQSWVALVP